MIDFMLRILPNNRILVIDKKLNTSETMRPSELSSYFEEKLHDLLELEKSADIKIQNIKGLVDEKK